MTPFLFLLAIQVVDIAVHLATGQVETMRILGSAILVLGGWLALGKIGPQATLVVAMLAYCGLNVLFVIDHGLINPATGTPRLPLLIFVLASVAAAIWVQRRARAG